MNKNAFIYVLLFSIPALLAALIISSLFFTTTAGRLWMFVLNDHPWPTSVNPVQTAGFCFVFFTTCISGLFTAYAFGKKQQQDTPLNLKHAMASIRATLLLVAIILGYQLHTGNIGPNTEGRMCAEFCMTRNFPSSNLFKMNNNAMMCNCLDTDGKDVLKTSIGDVMLEIRKLRQQQQ